MTDTRITPPFEDQVFTSHQQWVNKASSWLTRHPQYRNTEHGETKGWRGNHFTALCFDSFGRRVRNGGDFQKAHDEGAFPVWWIWPDQICELVMRTASTTTINDGTREASNDVLNERLRQMNVEGWTFKHDDQQTDRSMALAAGAYCESAARPDILARKPNGAFAIPKLWPHSWSLDWWKPKAPRADLVRAAALIIAEIERIDRAAALAARCAEHRKGGEA